MNLERTFTAELPEAVVAERARDFLGAAGYRAVSLSPIMYQRGTPLGSLVSLSPKKWQAQASVEVEPSGANRTVVALKVDVNTKGHLITRKETAYWNTELESFERTVIAGDVNAAAGLDESVAALTKSLKKGFLVFVLVALFVGLTVGLLASQIDQSLSRLGIVLGVGAGIVAARKHWGY